MVDANIDGETNFNFYHEYCRLYLANVVLMSQMRELVNERNELNVKFVKLEKKGEEIQEGERSDDNRKKRFRRTADEIERHYRCPIDTCQRSYGSEGSLNQHLKLKHYDLYEKLNLNRSEMEESHHDTSEPNKKKP
jgi:regulator of replication initiation timing